MELITNTYYSGVMLANGIAPVNQHKEWIMADFGYHTDEYVTENEIDNFLKCLQLEWLIKEHQEIREFIRDILMKNVPVPNRTIQVTTIGEIPNVTDQLPIISGINRTKEFGCRIAYRRDERFSVPDKTISQMLFGDHFVQADYNDSAKEFVICIQFNKFNEDVIKAQTQNYNQIKKETIQENFATHMHIDKAAKGSESTLIQQWEVRKPEPANTVDSKGRVPMEQIVLQLKELGVDSSWIKVFVEYASANGFKESLPNPKIEGVGSRVCLRFGKIAGHLPSDPSKLKLGIAGPEMEWKINQYGGFFYIPTAMANGIKDDAPAVQNFFDNLSNPQTTQPEKETEMASLPKTIDQLLKNVYCQRLQQAKLSNEAIAFVLGQVFHGSALKSPKEDSGFVIVAGKNDATIYYSHGNKPVVLARTENTKNTDEGEVIKYSTGIEDAVFVVDTSNTQEKLIHRHLGIPKLKLHFSNGAVADVPFDLERKVVNESGALIRVSCNALLTLRDKKLHSEDGPCVVDLTNKEKRQYFLDGVEHSEKEFRNRAATGPYTFMATE